jgi:hypothetical protein
MAVTGNQLRAARALIDMDHATLAQRSGVAVAAIDAMEKEAAKAVAGARDGVKAVLAALEAAGIEFLDQGRPGVRLKAVDHPNSLRANSNDEWPEADA